MKDDKGEDDETQITFRSVYDNLWALRNFEIEHVWHRAVFLSGFLLAVYAGYGGLLIGVLTADKLRVSWPVINGIAFGLAILGLVLSLLWIMMAKGSKAWYEHYENAIAAFVDYCSQNQMRKAAAFTNGVDEILELRIDKCPSFHVPPTDNSLLNTLGGGYSVSKINIVLGHISMVVFGALIVIHISLATIARFPILSFDGVKVLFLHPLTMLFIVLCVMIFFAYYAKKSLISTFLEETE